MSRRSRTATLFARKVISPNYLFVIAIGFGLLSSQTASATVIFSDNFSNGSTIPISPTTYPSTTSNSTGYAIASSKAQSPAPSITTGDLRFGIGATTSGVEEAQARFANSPVSLTNVGDAIEATITFSTTGILTAGTSSQLTFGLYNTSGTNPATDLSSSGIGGGTGDATGSAAGWSGLIAQHFLTGGSNSRMATRPPQTGTDNTNQDLLFNNASSSSTFHSPAGTTFTGSSSSAGNMTLTNGNTYTEDLLITLTATGLSYNSNLYNGSSVGGTPLGTISAANITGTPTSFDALAFGWRETGSVASQMDVSSVVVQTVPEPGAIVLLGLGALGLITMRRVRNGA